MKLSDHVHGIGPVSRGFTQGGWAQAYLVIGDDRELTLVDTLWDDDAHLILHYLNAIGYAPSDIAHIALTHGHRSHLGGVAQLQKLSGAAVHAHEDEADIIAGRRRAHPVSLWPPFPLPLIPFRILSWVGRPKHQPCEVTQLLNSSEGQSVGPLTVIPAPGHTSGHVAFAHEADQVLITGDAVATWPKFGAGWPGFNMDDEQYQRSLDDLLSRAARVIGTGHGDAIKSADSAQMTAKLRTLSSPSARARMGSRPLGERLGGPGARAG